MMLRQHLTPPGIHTIDNDTLLNVTCDIVEREVGCSSPATREVSDEQPITQLFMRSSGKFVLIGVYMNAYSISNLCTRTVITCTCTCT